MYFVEIADTIFNLEYLISIEKWGARPQAPPLGPGSIRITMEAGRIVDVPPPDAEMVLRHVRELVKPDPRSGRPEPLPIRPEPAATQPPRKRGKSEA